MANITRSNSGFIFLENFDSGDMSLLWTLSPNLKDRVVHNSDSISLLPGNERMELLITMPNESGYVMQSSLKYFPTDEHEAAGVTFRSITDSTVDLEVRGDTLHNTSIVKMSVDDYNVLSATGSDNGGINWREYGNTKIIDMNKIGFYIDGDTTKDNIEISEMVLYKSNYISFNNFDRKNIIRLYNRDDIEITDEFVIFRTNNSVKIDGTEMIFPIDYLKIRSFDRDTGELRYEGEVENIYGGDTFEYNYNIDFFVDGNKLENDIYDLGTICQEKEFVLKLVNKEAYPLLDRKLTVSWYSYLNPGYKAVSLSEVINGQDDEFKKELNISLLAGESKNFKMRVANFKSYLNLDDNYNFKITLE